MLESLTACGDALRNIGKPRFQVSRLITDAIGWFGLNVIGTSTTLFVTDGNHQAWYSRSMG
jgi:hypothetical protein